MNSASNYNFVFFNVCFDNQLQTHYAFYYLH